MELSHTHTVEPGYNDNGLRYASYIASYTMSQLIPNNIIKLLGWKGARL
jgi:hypothetical protein